MLTRAPETPEANDSSAQERPVSQAPFAVLFDSDGVIVDTEGISLRAFIQATREFVGAELSDEDIEGACGLRDSDIVARLRRVYETDIDLEAYRSRKQELYRLEADRTPVRSFPGVIELLEHLRHERIPYALASSGPRAKIEFNLRSADIREHFDVVVSGEEVEHGKPNPDIFLEAARRLGIEPERCIVVEDSINGILAAHAGRMPVLAVTNTFGHYQLHQANRVVDSLEHIRVADFHELLTSKPEGPTGIAPAPEPRRKRSGIQSLS